MKVGIIGATGYGGLELIRLLQSHGEVEQLKLFTSSEEGIAFSSKYTHLQNIIDSSLEAITAHAIKGLDVVFIGTPSGVSGQLIPRIWNEQTVFIDLSGDLRLKNSDHYIDWYKKEPAPEQFLQKSIYGLCSWNNAEIQQSKLIANPGCYPTAVLLSILPLLKGQLVSHQHIIIDAKSGISGSGNKPTQMTHFTETTECTTIYKINEHQHIPEIEQAIAHFTNHVEPITFSTHLVPMIRGIIATSYLQVNEGVSQEDLDALLVKEYADDPFVRVIPNGSKLSTNV